MPEYLLDTVGMKCPQPVLKLAVKAPQVPKGQKLTIKGDCSTFEQDIRTWCKRLNKTLISVKTEGSTVTMEIMF